MDKTFWELKKENTNSDAYETLETAVVQLVIAYSEAFAIRRPPQRSALES